MSHSRLTAAMKLRGLSFAQMRILTILANHENEKTGICNPSYDTIAMEAEISRRYAIKLVKSLTDDLSLIRIVPSKSNKDSFASNNYEFLFGKSTESNPSSLSKHDSSPPGDPQFTTQCTTVHHLVNYSSPKSIKRIKNKNLEYNLATCSCHIKYNKPIVDNPTNQANPMQGQAQEHVISLNSSFRPTFDQLVTTLENENIQINNLALLRSRFNETAQRGWKDASGRIIDNVIAYFAKLATTTPLDDQAKIREALATEAEKNFVKNNIIRAEVQRLEAQYDTETTAEQAKTYDSNPIIAA